MVNQLDISTSRRSSVATVISDVSVEDLENRNVSPSQAPLKRQQTPSEVVQSVVSQAMRNGEKKTSGVSHETKSSDVEGSAMEDAICEDPATSSSENANASKEMLPEACNTSVSAKKVSDGMTFEEKILCNLFRRRRGRWRHDGMDRMCGTARRAPAGRQAQMLD